MNERDIFLTAVDILDEEALTAFLDEQCGDDSELLTRVQQLLASHQKQSQFLQKPAVEQISDNSDAAAARTQQMSDGSTHEDDLEAPDHSEATMISELLEDDDEIPLGFLEPSDQEESLGRLKHYEILEVIGRGAFGIVLKAFDDNLKRVVAIKVLSPEMASTSPARKRFKREAESSAKVRHENVVAIYAVEEQPLPYIVMEYIPGENLQQRLDSTGPLDILKVLTLGKQMADGLTAAHAEGLIHRDIKPGNLLLETSINDHVKITDFGLARAADDASMTRSGVIAGTPMYMAPEQASGLKLDQRADLFSLGSVLYQMVCGRPPFRASSTVAVLKRVADDTPRPIQEIIPETPEWLCYLIGHLHAKDPEDRFESAQELSELLGRCLEDVKQGRLPEVEPPKEIAEELVRQAAEQRQFKQIMKKPVAKVAALLMFLIVGLGLAELTGASSLMRTTDHSDPVEQESLKNSIETASKTTTDSETQPGNAVEVSLDPQEFALEFNSAEDIVTFPGKGGELTAPFTIEMWVQTNPPEVLTWSRRHLAAFASDAGNLNIDIRFDLNQESLTDFMCTLNRNEQEGTWISASLPGAEYTSDGWTHLALIWDGSQFFSAIDGNRKWHKSNTTTDDESPNLEKVLGQLGGGSPLGSPFQGCIRELRLSRGARYSDSFSRPPLEQPFESDQHTLALYHFDEGQGDVLKDSSGNDYHGKIKGAKWVRLDSIPSSPPHNRVVSNEPIDLIALLDPERDFLDSRLKLDNGKLLTPKFESAPGSIGLIPVGSIPDDYDIELQLERVSNQFAGFNVGILVEGQQVSVGMDCGYTPKAWGLDFLDGKPAHKPENPTHNPGRRLLIGEICDVKIQVRGNHISTICNGETLVDWRGDPERLGPWSGLKLPKSDSLYFHSQADFIVHKMTLIPRISALSSSVTTPKFPADSPPPVIAPFTAEEEVESSDNDNAQ